MGSHIKSLWIHTVEIIKHTTDQTPSRFQLFYLKVFVSRNGIKHAMRSSAKLKHRPKKKNRNIFLQGANEKAYSSGNTEKEDKAKTFNFNKIYNLFIINTKSTYFTHFSEKLITY